MASTPSVACFSSIYKFRWNGANCTLGDRGSGERGCGERPKLTLSHSLVLPQPWLPVLVSAHPRAPAACVLKTARVGQDNDGEPIVLTCLIAPPHCADTTYTHMHVQASWRRL